MPTAAQQRTGYQTVRQRRDALGWSQADLAKAAKVSRPTIIQVERDEQYSHDITAIKTSSTSRRKVIDALDREEARREDLARRLTEEAQRDGKIIAQDVARRVQAGEMSERAALLATAAVVHKYAGQIGELDPATADEAQSYLDDIMADVIRKRSERN